MLGSFIVDPNDLEHDDGTDDQEAMEYVEVTSELTSGVERDQLNHLPSVSDDGDHHEMRHIVKEREEL